MSKIYSFEIDTSDMPTEATTRSFTVVANSGSKFIMFVTQEGTIKYYDWVSGTFELGHNDTNNNLKVTVTGRSYNGRINFPAGGGTYIIKLIPSSGTELQGVKNYVISESITKQSANSTVTFTPKTANAVNYATFPTSTSTGGVNSTGNFDFNWDVVNWNGAADAGSYGLRLTGDYRDIDDSYWFFEKEVDIAEDMQTNQMVVNSTTDLAIGMQLNSLSSGGIDVEEGTPVILRVDEENKILTLSSAQTISAGVTATFRAVGIQAIKQAIGLDIIFSRPTVTPTTLTQTVRADSDGDYTTSTTITLNDTLGIAGGNLISYFGVDVNNASTNKVTSVSTPDPNGVAGDGAITVQLTQLLRKGTVLTFRDVFKTINFAGNIIINSYPDANRTIYLDIDRLITVGAQS